jgi:hypothetical protein
MYWVCHAHDRLIILHSDTSSECEGGEYVLSTAPVPLGGSPATPAASDVPPEDARETWTPLVTRPKPEITSIHPMVIEDFVAYSSHLVLCCREGGLPVLRSVAWSEFGIAPTAPCPPDTPVDTAQQTSHGDTTQDAPESLADDVTQQQQAREQPVRAIPQDCVPELPLPAWAMHVVSGANLSFDAQVHVCHASSPAHPEQELTFHLPTAELLPPKPLPAQAMEAVRGMKARRLHVRAPFWVSVLISKSDAGHQEGITARACPMRTLGNLLRRNVSVMYAFGRTLRSSKRTLCTVHRLNFGVHGVHGEHGVHGMHFRPQCTP